MRLAAIALLGACSFTHGTLVSSPGDAAGTGSDGGPVGDALGADAAALACASYPTSHQNSRYRTGIATWYAAERACEAEGAHLVVIENSDENTFVLTLDPDGDIWIGMSDHLVEGSFRWLTGTAVVDGYQNWQALQPNNAGGAEDCGEMNLGGVWNDNGCGFTQTYVCECDGAALPSSPTWCETGTNQNCGSCGDDCSALGESCSGQICS